MPFYQAERKAALLKMMLPPLSLSAAEGARREGCNDMSLHYWRKQAAARGTQLSDAKQPAENWSAESKLAVIIETSALSELELGEYCRRKGIFPEQITDWRNAFIALCNYKLLAGLELRGSDSTVAGVGREWALASRAACCLSRS